MTDKEAEPFYRSITGFYETKKAIPKKDPEEWAKESNDVLKDQGIQKRVIDIEGGEEVYPKWFVRSLVAIVFLLLAGVVIAGIFVYKYQPAKIDQPISINPNITVQGDTVNVDATDEINPQFYNENQATIIIEKVEVTCGPGGCMGEAGGNESG